MNRLGFNSHIPIIYYISFSWLLGSKNTFSIFDSLVVILLNLFVFQSEKQLFSSLQNIRIFDLSWINWSKNCYKLIRFSLWAIKKKNPQLIWVQDNKILLFSEEFFYIVVYNLARYESSVAISFIVCKM